LNLDSYDENDVLQQLGNFTSVLFTTTKKTTGTYLIKTSAGFAPTATTSEVLARYKGKEYRIAIPRNKIVDDTLSITDTNNIYAPQGTGGTPPLHLPKMKGRTLTTRLTLDNLDNIKLVLSDVNLIFEPYMR
jgi:hypothetical protein